MFLLLYRIIIYYKDLLTIEKSKTVSINGAQIEEQKRTFITYENQRWWVGNGFTASTYPGGYHLSTYMLISNIRERLME